MDRMRALLQTPHYYFPTFYLPVIVSWLHQWASQELRIQQEVSKATIDYIERHQLSPKAAEAYFDQERKKHPDTANQLGGNILALLHNNLLFADSASTPPLIRLARVTTDLAKLVFNSHVSLLNARIQQIPLQIEAEHLQETYSLTQHDAYRLLKTYSEHLGADPDKLANIPYELPEELSQSVAGTNNGETFDAKAQLEKYRRKKEMDSLKLKLHAALSTFELSTTELEWAYNTLLASADNGTDTLQTLYKLLSPSQAHSERLRSPGILIEVLENAQGYGMPPSQSLKEFLAGRFMLRITGDTKAHGYKRSDQKKVSPPTPEAPASQKSLQLPTTLLPALQDPVRLILSSLPLKRSLDVIGRLQQAYQRDTHLPPGDRTVLQNTLDALYYAPIRAAKSNPAFIDTIGNFVYLKGPQKARMIAREAAFVAYVNGHALMTSRLEEVRDYWRVMPHDVRDFLEDTFHPQDQNSRITSVPKARARVIIEGMKKYLRRIKVPLDEVFPPPVKPGKKEMARSA